MGMVLSVPLLVAGLLLLALGSRGRQPFRKFHGRAVPGGEGT